MVRLLASCRVACMAGLSPVLLAAQTSPTSDSLGLRLEAAVARVLRDGDEVRIADAQLAATRAQIEVARATGLPQLRFNGSYQQVLENARANIVGAVFNQNYVYNASGVLQQTVFQGGRIMSGVRAANAARRAAGASGEEVRAQAVVDVQRAYLQALFTDRVITIQTRNLAVADERLAQTQQLEAAGRASRYDVLRVKVERANLEPALVQARNDHALALLALKRLVNMHPQQPLRLESDVDTLTLPRVLALADSLDDRHRRAAVTAAEMTLDARTAGVRVARADLFPQISVSGTLGFLALPTAAQFPTRGGSTSNAFCPPGSAATRVCQNNGWFSDRNIGVQVTWPLFDGLRTKGNLDAAHAAQDLARAQLAQVREAVAVEAAAARAEFTRARTLYDARRATTGEAREALDLARLRNTRGLGTALEVSDAQLNLVRAEVNAARAIYDVFLAAADLARATGHPIPMPDGTQIRVDERGLVPRR
jgi:outer membrane protein